uniref:Oxidation resistance protein 1 n=1 Tax=Chenopodium quinoa TaxID=63459 RepID=A0A803KSK3_CHEQI
MGKQRSFRSKAVNLVSDLTTVLLNPISDKISKNPPSPPENNDVDSGQSQLESICEEGSVTSVDGPDTSSFTAFLYSLLKDDYFSAERDDGPQNNNIEPAEPENVSIVRESGGRRGLISKGRQSIGKAMNYAAKLAWFRNQASERMPKSEAKTDENPDHTICFPSITCQGEEMGVALQHVEAWHITLNPVPEKHALLWLEPAGIFFSTLYLPISIVVGDRGGAVFGGLVEAPLKPSKSRRYQGSNSTFLFTDVPGQPIIYRPTGVNRYYTVCSPDFLAMGGGRHFALYLDSDLLNGSSAASDTYGNSCLALSEDFVVKEVELWGFVNASRYEEILALSQNELPGICRW